MKHETNDVQGFGKQLEKELGDDFAALVMYGSKASGVSDEFSDTDLCVVVRRRNGEIDNKLSEAAATMTDSSAFVVAVDTAEFERNIRAGDVFYKREILEKGQLICENNGYISGMYTHAASQEPDFPLGREAQAERYRVDKEGLRGDLENVMDRLAWGFSDLVYLRFAETRVEPGGLEDVPDLMSRDDVLSDYAGDFEELITLNKEYRHHRISFPFDKLKYFHGRLQELEQKMPQYADGDTLA